MGQPRDKRYDWLARRGWLLKRLAQLPCMDHGAPKALADPSTELFHPFTSLTIGRSVAMQAELEFQDGDNI
jgi:hypothetical protein